ncbi:MAG: DUF481 domain-containing protein [Fimbriimonadaceae bacterium]|nr:DUF481 domain-containing protein [Fimbriimonadaceae bacterium]
MNLNLGLGFVQSNTRSQSISLLGQAVKETKGIDRIRINGGLFNTRQSTVNGPLVTTQDYWTFGGRYDRNISSRLAGYVSTRFTRDEIAFLDLRSQYGFGLAYDVYPSDGVWSWRVSGGISFLREEYTGSLGSKSDTGLEFGSSYKRAISKSFSVTNETSFIPRVDAWDNSFTSFVTSLSYQLNSNLNLAVIYLVD